MPWISDSTADGWPPDAAHRCATGGLGALPGTLGDDPPSSSQRAVAPRKAIFSDVTARSRHACRLTTLKKAGGGGSIPSLATSNFHTVTSIFVTQVCLCGVHMESNPFGSQW
jgi:hypothetical protein